MNLLAENQTLTGTFAKLGTGVLVIPTSIKFSFITLSLEININDSKNLQVKPLFEDDVGDLFHFPLENVRKDKVTVVPLFKEFDDDVDQKILVEFELDATIDLVQIHVRVGTVGATAGIITKAQFNLGHRQ